ncbi:MAG TPA: WalW protein [Gammaproteobacteria bacterium]|nr:WalW protein [Gammaproteobacteria bacterium]
MAAPHKPDILFILSIDTEEEWGWSGPFPNSDFSVKNIQRLPAFQEFCETLKIRPTYFVDYAVADNQESADALKTFANNNMCEIGAHLHPWCNPPYFGKSGEKESHVINLPISQVDEKLEELISILNRQFNIMPNSFRTGRWGVDSKILQLLVKKGFQVDSSMYPFYKNKYFNNEKVRLEPYWPDYNNPIEQGSQRNIVEIPVTVGFNRKNFPLMLQIYNFITHPLLKHLHLTGIFWHTRLLRKIYLSPESTSGKDMEALVDSTLDNHQPVIHMYFHSSSLIDGATGLMPGKQTNDTICNNIKHIIGYLQKKANVRFCTISEAATILKQRKNDT